MDLLTLVRLFRRNLLVGLMAIAVAGALLAAVVVTAPPVYRSSGSVVLFSPPLAPDLEPGETPPDGVENPYVRFNDLSVVVDIVRRVLVGRDVDAELRELGVVGTYTVAANLDYYRGPIVDVVVEAPTAAAARTSTELVMTRLETVLDDLQAREGTQPTYRIKSEVVVHPQDGTRVLSSTLRRGMAGSVLAAGLVVLAVLASEAWRNRRAAGPAGRRPTRMSSTTRMNSRTRSTRMRRSCSTRPTTTSTASSDPAPRARPGDGLRSVVRGDCRAHGDPSTLARADRTDGT